MLKNYQIDMESIILIVKNHFYKLQYEDIKKSFRKF